MRQQVPEPDAFAVIGIVPSGSPVSWKAGDDEPHQAIWLPEEEWFRLAALSRQLGRIDIYQQTRLHRDAVMTVKRELDEAPSDSLVADIQDLLTAYIQAPDAVDLLIEGP